MTPATGLLVMSYGTARGLEDVPAFYTHIRGGRPPSAELLADLTERYRAIGGRSPLLEITAAQVSGLERELNGNGNRSGRAFRAYNGMRHQSPYLEDAVARMASDGIRDAVGLVLAPHFSTMSVGAYVERASRAAGEAGVSMSFVESYHDDPRFVAFVAERVEEARGRLPADVRDAAVVVFSAHSLPERILEAGDPYPDQLGETAEAVAARLGLGAAAFRLAWQSAGQTGEPWLGPDLVEMIRDLGAEGVRGVVSSPVGFLADHLEILYDVDIEAADAARAAGVAFVRTRSPNDDPEFLRVLAGVVRRHLEEER